MHRGACAEEFPVRRPSSEVFAGGVENPAPPASARCQEWRVASSGPLHGV